VHEIKDWLHSNFLKLDKTEIIFTGSPSLTCKIPTNFTCEIAGSHMKPSSTVKNLGIIFDSSLSFLTHFNSITKSAFFHLHRISINGAETVIHAFVTSCLEYCNALFIGLSASSFSKLHYIQNSSARILSHTKRSTHITPILYDLRWLPVAYCMKYKILLLNFKSAQLGSPISVTTLTLRITLYDPPTLTFSLSLCIA